MIDWGAFTWEAFAVLISGFFAVAGAYHIGLKQTKILQNQNHISETNVRVALFERRSLCIKRMHEIHSMWMRNARLSSEEWREFYQMFLESELIFSKKLAEEIDEALDGLFWQEHWRKRSLEEYERGASESAASNLRKSFDEDDKVFKLMPSLLKKMKEESRVADWL